MKTYNKKPHSQSSSFEDDGVSINAATVTRIEKIANLVIQYIDGRSCDEGTKSKEERIFWVYKSLEKAIDKELTKNF